MRSRLTMVLIALLVILLPFVAAATSPSEPEPDAMETEMSGDLTLAIWGQIDADPNHPVYTVHEILQQWNDMYPEVDLKYEINGSPSVLDKFTWIKTRMLSETLPDVVMIYFAGEDYFDRELMYDLAPEYDKPNPYSDSATWRDDFPQDAEILRSKTMPDGGVYVAGYTQSGNVGATSFIYNKDIFDEVGATVPGTWEEFLEVQQKIKDAGYTPFLQPTAGPLGWQIDWPRWVLQWQLFDGIYPEVDVQEPFGVVSQYEVLRAYKRGIFSPYDERYKETWRLMKEWSQYWQEGFLAPPEGNPFVEGKAAMQHTMTLWIGQIAANPNIDFEWGTFYQPQITSDSTPFATGAIPQRVGNSGAGASASLFFMIPQSTVRRGRLGLALDMLQYATAPDQLEQWCGGQTIPCFAPGTPVDAVYPNDTDKQRQMAGFFDPPAFENGSTNLNFNGMSADAGTQIIKLLQEYLGDAMSLDEAIDELDAILEVAAEDLIATHPEWEVDW